MENNIRIESLKKGEYYVLKEKDYAYNWITRHNGGKNKGSICFYDKETTYNIPYFSEEADFGKNYCNFRNITIRKATNLEKKWLDASIKENMLVEYPKQSLSHHLFIF